MSDLEGKRPNAIERCVENLSRILRAVLPGGHQQPLHAGPVDAFMALVLLLAIEALVYAITVASGALSYWEMRAFAGALVFHVLVVATVALALRRAGDLNSIVVGLLWALILGQVLALLVSFFVSIDTLFGWLFAYAVPSLLPAVLFLLSALGLVGGLAASVALIASVTVIVLEWSGVSFWGDDAEEVDVGPLIDTEAVYAAQSGLLKLQTSALRPGDPAKVELFALLGAGYPYERVFQREVEAVSTLLEADFGAEGRTVRLVNSIQAPTSLPLLNRTNLGSALKAMGDAMDPEDILFLFLTSHGGEGVLATEFASVMTRNLSPEDIGDALDASGIRNAVLVVSSCYSGSFAETLSAPSRLVLTAASADRTSFGCSDQAEWTNWGRAFFVEALDETRDPRLAALIARDLVAEWEEEEGFPASEPVILEGAAIGTVLDRWLQTFE